jgi:DNA-binding CsgD family transcriptional regulator
VRPAIAVAASRLNSGQVISNDAAAVMVPTDVVEILITLGETRHAEQALDVLERWGESEGHALPQAASLRCRALLGAARGDLGVALDTLCRALEAECDETSTESARTLLAMGNVLRRVGRRQEARHALARACKVFDARGASALAGRCRAELGLLRSRAGGLGELTPTERRVAEHAAAGLTNREVAAGLGVSQRGVEMHLSNVYLKLGIHSRTQLAVVVATRGLDAALLECRPA